MRNLILRSFLFISLCASFSYANSDLAEWSITARKIAMKNLMLNVSALGTMPGSVIASPSKADPDYYYHWVRDSGLVVNTLVGEYEKTKMRSAKDQLLKVLIDGIQFNLTIQRSSHFGKGLGEPRFNVDGTLSTVPWPRPQDDGPALRAISMIRLANVWFSEGHEDWVRAKLYKAHGESLIKQDLEFLSHHWQRTSFDLWEELHGHHFFTRLAQRRALVEGSRLALRLGDFEAGGWYSKQAKLLESELQRHWDPNRGYIVSTLDRDGGIDYKHQNLDTSVIISVLHSSLRDGFFSFSDERVLLTVSKLTETFKSLYPINQNGLLGLAIGRYPEDRYDGISPSAEGNPWVLTTAALAEFYYRLARQIEEEGSVTISPQKFEFLKGVGISGIAIAEQIHTNHSSYPDILRKLRNVGDGFLNRIKIHGHTNGSLSEQINKHSGMMQGAQDLTWSYSSLINAIDSRN